MKKFRLFLIILLCLIAAQCGFAQDINSASKSRIAIISAMDTEIDLLLAQADIEYEDHAADIVFNVGTLCGKDVVIVKAGIGKVMSASGTAALFNRYNISSLIFTGVAGGVGDETKELDMVIATDLVQHDFGMITDDSIAGRL